MFDILCLLLALEVIIHEDGMVILEEECLFNLATLSFLRFFMIFWYIRQASYELFMKLYMFLSIDLTSQDPMVLSYILRGNIFHLDLT
jgi:hypothetical protein